jgi:hypothetical protein
VKRDHDWGCFQRFATGFLFVLVAALPPGGFLASS